SSGECMYSHYYSLTGAPIIVTILTYTTLFRSIHVHADRVDDRLRHLCERLRQRGLIHVVLVHPHADALGDVPARRGTDRAGGGRSVEHTSELQSRDNLVFGLLFENKN